MQVISASFIREAGPMWVLIVITLLTWGNPQGATSAYRVNLSSERACNEAAAKIYDRVASQGRLDSVVAFCVYDDIYSTFSK